MALLRRPGCGFFTFDYESRKLRPMRPVGDRFLPVVFGFLLALTGQAADSNSASAPDFQELYAIIRDHLEGTNPADLNRMAVDALVEKLRPKVELVRPAQSISVSEAPLVKTSNVFDGSVAYLRISRVSEGLAQAVRQAYQNIGTNKLSGLVLDLRFAGGDDYDAAAQTADIFLSKDKPLLDWGKGLVRSKEKNDAIREPVAVLINAQTTRAAEALAAVLRETGTALLLGSKTAGQAMVCEEYPLKNGDRLRIATAPVHVGEGTPLSVQGVKPDISVEVSPQDELAYYADAYRELSRTNNFKSTGVANEQLSGTNRLRRPRVNEAELVRERREGFSPEGQIAASRSEGEIEKPVVRDPALARALDVLKGLAVVRRSRS